MTSFEEKVNQRLVDTGLTTQVLAEQIGMPEAQLRVLCQLGDPRLSELEKMAKPLGGHSLPFLNPVTQGGAFNAARVDNVQKIKIGKAAVHELAQQLSTCQRTLDVTNTLVAAEDEIIHLLRSSSNRLN